MIIGVAGKKRHGKDTFSELLKEKHNDFKIIHFADDLKQMTSDIFEIHIDNFIHQSLKEVVFDKPIDMDLYLDKMSSTVGLSVKPRGLVAHSPRELMQFFGTEYVRSVSNYYWIKRVVDKINSGGDFIVSDVRFVNEAKSIQDLGGKIVKVTMVGALDVSSHSSETSIDDIVADIDVYNEYGKLNELKAKAEEILTSFLPLYSDHSSKLQ